MSSHSRPGRFNFRLPIFYFGAAFFAWGLLLAPAPAQEQPAPIPPAEKPPAGEGEEAKLVPLNEQKTILLDRANRKLIVETKVVLQEGMLEMLLCKQQTKEHESILAFEGEAKILHAGLLALGLEPGTPVVFIPEFKPPTGPKLKIELVWEDKEGEEQRVPAHRWIRHSIHRYFAAPLAMLPTDVDLPQDDPLRYDSTNNELSWYGPMNAKQRDHYLSLSEDPDWEEAIKSFYERTRSRPLTADFVFAGSQFAINEATGERIYLAESGDVICVANFPSAMIDISERSSADGQSTLLYEAWAERIPPRDTPVRLEISPADKEGASGQGEEGEK